MSEIDTGNTAWMLFSTALVFFMTPGLALYYGGMTREKNVAATIMQSLMVMAVVAVVWVLVGYSLAFGEDQGLGLIGGLDLAGLRGVAVGIDRFGGSDLDHLLAHGVPDLLFMAFYMTYAILTPALITGAFAERARFGPFLLFIAIWSVVVFAPVLHWVFGVNGWLNTFSGEGVHLHTGVNGLDFAGGLAVHVNAGFAALAAVFVFGRRRGYGVAPMEPHNVTKIVLGSSMMWFACIGFAAGSAVAADEQAVYAFASTVVAAGAGSVAWVLVGWLHGRRPGIIGASSGVTAGLVAITPASGFVEPMEAIAIGLAAGAICYYAVRWRPRTGLDDSLDVMGVHGVGGIWGALATGIFASSVVGAPDFREGLIHGEWRLLWDQVIGIAAVGGWSFGATFAILKGLDLTVGVRATAEQEETGLDLSQHGERAYVRREGPQDIPEGLFPGGIMAQPIAPLSQVQSIPQGLFPGGIMAQPIAPLAGLPSASGLPPQPPLPSTLAAAPPGPPPDIGSPPDLQPPVLQPSDLAPPSDAQPPTLQPPELAPPTLQPPELAPPLDGPPPPDGQPPTLQPPPLQPSPIQPPAIPPPDGDGGERGP